MALDATALKQLIVDQVGDTADALVAGKVGTLWDLHDDQPSLKLRFLYAKRDAITLLMGRVREQVTQSGLNNLAVELTDKLTNLQTMWDNVAGEIAAQEAKAGQQAQTSQQGTRQPAVGQIRQTAPVMAPFGSLDANDPRYRGDAYRGRR